MLVPTGSVSFAVSPLVPVQDDGLDHADYCTLLPALTSCPAAPPCLQLLAFLDETFPTWANNGCRLVHMGSGGQVEAPTPAEAAYALKGVGLAAKRAGLSQVRPHVALLLATCSAAHSSPRGPVYHVPHAVRRCQLRTCCCVAPPKCNHPACVTSAHVHRTCPRKAASPGTSSTTLCPCLCRLHAWAWHVTATCWA